MNNFLIGKKYINLDSLYSKEYLENQYKGKGQPFIVDGEEYFVRRITNDSRAYKELIAEEILNVLKISHVNYELVKLFDTPCLICKSFFKEDINIVNGYEVLEQYNKNKQYDIDYMNNLDMIKLAFLERYKVS